MDKKFLKLLAFILYAVLFLYALALIIVGIHIIIDHGNMLEITRSSIYITGVYILIFCGILLLFGVIIGFLGLIKNDRFFMITFFVLIIILIILTFIGSILLLAFKASFDASTKNVMKDTLKNQYHRINLYTVAWDDTQSRLRCCGVDDRGWNIYRDSYYDNITNMDMNSRERKIPSFNAYYKFVPESCCWRFIDPRTKWPSLELRNKQQCQHWQFGPPTKTNGPQNDAIYYRGCGEALKSFVGVYADGVGAFSLIFIIFLIAALVLTLFQLKKSTKEGKKEEKPVYANERYDARSFLAPPLEYNDENESLQDRPPPEVDHVNSDI